MLICYTKLHKNKFEIYFNMRNTYTQTKPAENFFFIEDTFINATCEIVKQELNGHHNVLLNRIKLTGILNPTIIFWTLCNKFLNVINNRDYFSLHLLSSQRCIWKDFKKQII